MQRYDVTANDGCFELSGLIEANSYDMALCELIRGSSISRANIKKATIIERPWRNIGAVHSISKSYQNRLRERTNVR